MLGPGEALSRSGLHPRLASFRNKPDSAESQYWRNRLVRDGFLSGEDAMTRLMFAAFCLAIFALVGCGQATTDPAKATADKPGAARSQAPAPNSLPAERGGEGGGGGGY